MSNVIQFLEAMGQRPAMSPADYAATVAALDVDDAQREALLEGDQAGLNQLLDGRMKMVFAVFAPLEDVPDSLPDDDGDGVPDQDVPDQGEPEPLQK